LRRFAQDDALSLPRSHELKPGKGVDQFEVHYPIDRG
jgi:hypothetical protein